MNNFKIKNKVDFLTNYCNKLKKLIFLNKFIKCIILNCFHNIFISALYYFKFISFFKAFYSIIFLQLSIIIFLIFYNNFNYKLYIYNVIIKNNYKMDKDKLKSANNKYIKNIFCLILPLLLAILIDTIGLSFYKTEIDNLCKIFIFIGLISNSIIILENFIDLANSYINHKI